MVFKFNKLSILIILFYSISIYSNNFCNNEELLKLEQIPINQIENAEYLILLQKHKECFDYKANQGILTNYYKSEAYSILSKKEPSHLSENEFALYQYLQKLDYIYNNSLKNSKSIIIDSTNLNTSNNKKIILSNNKIVQIDSLNSIEFKSIGEPFMIGGIFIAMAGVALATISYSAASSESNSGDWGTAMFGGLFTIGGIAWGAIGTGMLTFGIVKTSNDKKEFRNKIQNAKEKKYNTEFNLGISMPLPSKR